jgi:hypothetical protein
MSAQHITVKRRSGRRAEMTRGGFSLLVRLLMVLGMLLMSGPGSRGVLCAAQGESTATVKYSQYLEVRPGELKGQVLYPDGKTPAATVPVRVWDLSEKSFVHQTSTDEKGQYNLPTLKEGRYLLIFGDRVSVDLRVVESGDTKTRMLDVIIPRGRAFFSPEEMQVELAEEGSGGNRKLLNALILAGLVATAVAVPIALHDGGGGHHGVVSP